MANYRIQRKEGTEGSSVYEYTAPGHNICTPTRLFDPDGGPNGVDGTKMIMGITHFQPGGGCDYGANPLESIYYILSGEMTLRPRARRPYSTRATASSAPAARPRA